MRTASVTVRLHRSESDALRAVARARRCSMAEVVRRSLRAELHAEQPTLPFDVCDQEPTMRHPCPHPMGRRWRDVCQICGEKVPASSAA